MGTKNTLQANGSSAATQIMDTITVWKFSISWLLHDKEQGNLWHSVSLLKQPLDISWSRVLSNGIITRSTRWKLRKIERNVSAVCSVCAASQLYMYSRSDAPPSFAFSVQTQPNKVTTEAMYEPHAMQKVWQLYVSVEYICTLNMGVAYVVMLQISLYSVSQMSTNFQNSFTFTKRIKI